MERVYNYGLSMLLMMRTLIIFLTGKKKDRKKTDGPKKKKTRTTFTAYQVISNCQTDHTLKLFKTGPCKALSTFSSKFSCFIKFLCHPKNSPNFTCVSSDYSWKSLNEPLSVHLIQMSLQVRHF